MSSMVSNLRFKALSCAALGAFVLGAPSSAKVEAQNGSTPMVAQLPSSVDAAISKWELLQKERELSFGEYAGFAVAYPAYPRMEIIRLRAEKALELEAPGRTELLRFFDTHPPLTNPARARYAIALAGAGRVEAFNVAREAWRGGRMEESVELTLNELYSRRLTRADHNARMDALLWQNEAPAATRHMISLRPEDRSLAMARLALVNGASPAEAGLTTPANAMQSAGYIYNLVNYHLANRDNRAAVSVLSSRGTVAAPALDGEEMIGVILRVAKTASASDAMRIASKVDDLFEPGADISEGSFTLRDRYTDLMWLGGTKALWTLGQGERAKSLFERYARAARSPLTRAKGFYWAGRAARRAGSAQEASRLYTEASRWPDYYYSQLALEALGQPMPEFGALPRPAISAEQRREFEARPLAVALKAMAKQRRRWQTERRFFQAIADETANETEMLMAHDLASRLGLREMSVVLGLKNGELGYSGLERIGFPTIETPLVRDWAMVHGISRQESEFDRTRVSHAGARGIMQLMPGTAREQSQKLGVQYMRASLIEKPQYNIELGDAYFQRMLRYYDGAHPLAVGAYNAGPGRVNQWLRLNGDPRKGDIDWVTWVEKIPANFETRYYIMRVIGNAVTYSHMYPGKAGLPRNVDAFLP
ncbi:MAG: lytic transglycosylase domain-containing protein [Pseudomonadota bacterium]